MKPIVTKKYLSLLFETGTRKILEVLYKYPEKEFSLSDLANESGVRKAHIGKILNNLHNANLVNIIKLSKIWRIKANQQNWNFMKSKIVYNMNFIYQSGLVEFLYEKFNHPKAIIVFGSFRKGEDISNSDIDIAIETNEDTEYRVIKHLELDSFEKEIGRNIQIHLFNRKDIDINVFNNIANGVVLLGFLEVHP